MDKLLSLIINPKGLIVVYFLGVASGAYGLHVLHGYMDNNETKKALNTVIKNGDKINDIKNQNRALPSSAVVDKLRLHWQRD